MAFLKLTLVYCYDNDREVNVLIDIEELIIAKRSLRKIGDLFGITENDLNNPNCGDWIADQIKQLQQTALLVKGLQKQLSNNGSVENFPHVSLQVTEKENDPEV